MSPVVDAKLAHEWPRSQVGYDEWYFFRNVPTIEKLHALCNWQGVSPGAAVSLRDVPSGFDLQEQLEKYEPCVVLGDGHRIFVISQDAGTAREFLEACERRRTRR